ncbi:MAG: toll/interleukin-1 receptor domain-containing protein [Acidobacteria bacterium]|nr:toll/interleukin-1 receptor domain-containing protein [Acidobacteriota bacterium]MBI3426344.1 toll/interleukin-1 receptor domain-containing protein [Acidobacteriota bacterium]
MGYIPGYEHDIFVSYAHIDNDPLIKGVPGWVDFFEDLLRKTLRVKLGAEITIFRDPQLNGFETFSEQLAGALEQSAVMLAVISPRYIKAEWCLWELREFQKRTGGGRLLKAVKTSIEGGSFQLDGQALLASIKDVLEHRFYYEEERSGRHIDLQPELKTKDIPDFVDKVNALCEDLHLLFRRLRGSGTLPAPAPPLPLIPAPVPVLAPTPNPMPAPAPPPPPSVLPNSASAAITTEMPAVYLAEPAPDQVEAHKLIKSELQQFKFRVLPDQPLPSAVEEFNTAVQQYLEQAQLAVHLLGEKYGGILDVDVEERSMPHVQYDLAAALAQAKKLTQLVWLPPGLTLKAGGQQERFVTQVKNTSPEFLQVKLEDLKTEIHKKLKPPPKDIWAELAGDPVTVCLFCHEQDFAQVGPLFSYLKLEKAFKVKLPLQSQEPPERYKQLLQSSDAVLLYYGAADEEWFGNIWRVIQKLSATGRTKPLAAKAIYIGEAETMEKDLLNSSDPLVLKNYAPFTPEIIEPFVQRIRAATEGR